MDKGNTLYGVRSGITRSEVSQSSSVNLALFEVIPIKYKSPWTGDLLIYTRIKTENLHKEIIQRVFELRGSQIPMQVIESPIYLITQYGTKPPLFIKRGNGRVYASMQMGYDQNMIEHQASILLEVLDKAGLVEDLHAKKISLKMDQKQKSKRDSPDQDPYKSGQTNL